MEEKTLFIQTAFPSHSFLLWGSPWQYSLFPLSPHPEDPRGISLFSALMELENEEPGCLKGGFRLGVCVGPGAMTGLKYGIAIALGIALSLGKKITPVPSFFGWYDPTLSPQTITIPQGKMGAYGATLVNSGGHWEVRDPRWLPGSYGEFIPPSPRSFLLAVEALPPSFPQEVKPLYIRPPEIYPQKDLQGRLLTELFPPVPQEISSLTDPSSPEGT